MSRAGGDGERGGLDLLGVVLLGLLAAAAIGAVYAIVNAGYMTAGALFALFAVGGAFVVVASMGGKAVTPKNSNVHGEARQATEQEVLRAARGEPHQARLDEREF